MSNVLEKAAELAEALEVCEEMKNMKDKEAAIKQDPEASTILNSYFQMQNELYQLQEMGKEPEAELVAQFNEVQNKMEANIHIAEFYKCQEELGKLLQKINGLISKAITGEDPTECAPSDCVSCVGCH